MELLVSNLAENIVLVESPEQSVQLIILLFKTRKLHHFCIQLSAVFRRAFLIYKADKVTGLCASVLGDLADFFKNDLVKHLRSDGVWCALSFAHMLSVTAANKSVGICFECCSSDEVQL